MLLSEAIQIYIEHRRARVSAQSVRVYRGWLLRWQRWRERNNYPPELHAVSIVEMHAYFAEMNDSRLAPASRDATWRVFKALWRLLERRGLLEAVQLHFFGEDGIPRVQVPEEIRPVYSRVEIVKLVAACTCLNPEQESRNQAIIYLLWHTGGRVAEICSLTDDKTELESMRGVIRGKGNRPRWLFWEEEAAIALNRYLLVRRGPWGGSLLRDLQSGGSLTENAIRQMVRRAARRAGVRLIPRSPLHGFRRTFAHEALDAGIADLDLQQLLGHRSISSTQRYTRRDPARLDKVYRRMRGRIGEKGRDS